MLKVPSPIVSVDWLNDHLEAEELVILNGTIPKVTAKGSDDLKHNYIKNARFFDIKKEFSVVDAPFPNTMISAEEFEQKAQNLGIHNDSCIVVYDDYGLYSAARVWWMFKAMGLDNIAVLDGGLPAWVENGFQEFEKPFERFDKGDFKVTFKEGLIHNHIPVLEAIDHKQIEILDARSNDRFLGLADEPRKGLRSGHIPSSKSMPYASLLKDNKLKSKDELIKMFSPYENKQLIFSCGSGITACVLALGAEIAGIENKSVYDGSWTEWGSLTKLPIEKN